MPGTAQVNVNPRKIPRQARAQATVEAIIVATAQLLTEQGFVNLTTARVAERAGVSIGSLYQYFPTKQGLAAAVVLGWASAPRESSGPPRPPASEKLDVPEGEGPVPG